MATQQDAHKELFLDMLTKEEKEALLTKKMESLRKQNEAIQKRYEAPQAEDHDPRKNRQQQQLPPQPQQQQQSQQNSRPATRNKPPAPHGGGGKGLRERPKSQDFRSEAAYQYEPIVDIADLDYRHAKRAQSPSKARRNAPRENAPVVSNNAHTSPPEGAADTSSNFYRPRQVRGRSQGSREPHDDQFRNSHARGRQPWGGGGGLVYTQTFSSRRQPQGRVPSEDGPPPDPAYNYLSDRSRDSATTNSRHGDKPSNPEGGGGGRGGKDLRRHPRNFGGSDFNNVKPQMKAVKEKERDRRSYPPRNRLEMTLNMTGSERFHYEEWKAERQKVDQERMDRQKTSSGEWRRAWDQEKHFKEYDEPPSPGRTEPAKRPVGRIGSGRFDRGDRDDRRAESLSQSPKAPSMMQGVAPSENERKPLPGRGRGRGRGRARAQQPGAPGGPGEKPLRPRTWSGGDDSRTVECSNDMLVVKIDNSRGSDDHSVEVEYGSGNETEKKKSSPAKKKSSRRSPTKQKQHQQQPQFQDAEVPGNKSASSPPVLTTMSSQDSSIYDGRPASLSQSLSVGSTDEWEDMTGTTTEDEGESYRRGSGRLNPEAPVFLPTSADLILSSPGFDAAPKEQRGHRSPASRSMSGASSRSANSMASSVTSEPASPSTMPAPPKSFPGGADSTANGRQDPEVEEDKEENPTPERDVLGDDAHEDLKQDQEDDDDHFFDSEDKVETVAGAENGLLTEPSTDDLEEKEQEEEAGSQEVSSLTDELSAAGHHGDRVQDIDSSLGTVASSLADELCAAGAPLHSGSPPQPQLSVQDNLSSQEVCEIEEDDMEEETEPTVSHADMVPQGEALPDTATASGETEEVKSAPADADSSCQAAPEDSACSSPKPSGKQMAASEEDGGSPDGVQEPSSRLTSSGSEAAQESAETSVMEKPDAHHVSGNAAEATQASEESAATENVSTTSPTA